MSISISIIIPVLNEAELVADTLSRVSRIEATESARIGEVIVVDGGSADETMHRAESFLASDEWRASRKTLAPLPEVRILSGERGRAAQMNVGATAATGEVLLFLHADCTPSPRTCGALEKAVQGGWSAGSFRHQIAGRQWLYRVIEWGDGIRQSWLRMPYGDQALFVCRELFEQIGGFPDVPLMEDVRLVRKLRKLVPLIVIDEPVITDARRWRRRGILRQFLTNQYLLIAERVGVPLERLAKIYYA